MHINSDEKWSGSASPNYSKPQSQAWKLCVLRHSFGRRPFLLWPCDLSSIKLFATGSEIVSDGRTGKTSGVHSEEI